MIVRVRVRVMVKHQMVARHRQVVDFRWPCVDGCNHLWRNTFGTDLWECMYCHSATNQFDMTWEDVLRRLDLDSDLKVAKSGRVARQQSVRARKSRKLAILGGQTAATRPHTLSRMEAQDEWECMYCHLGQTYW